MKILVINAGSSSIKFQLIDMQNEKLICKGLVEKIGEQMSAITYKHSGIVTEREVKLPSHKEAMQKTLELITDPQIGVIKSLNEITAIGHRVLHGSDKYMSAVIVDEKVLSDLKSYVPLGPLHMPANILGIEACQKVMPDKKNIAVFDTAFHATMPDYAYMYATPYEWFTKYKVRKFGFHGTSHEFIAYEIARAMKKDIKDLKIISCHLGNGASIAAVKNGKCVDTSMGFTPLEGLVMGTRCGNIDPAVIEYVMNQENLSISQVIDMLNKKSGLLALSGISNDMRDVSKGMSEGNDRCRLAIDKFVYEVKKYIGAYAYAMGGVDAIAFAAGTGENRDEIRAMIMQGSEFLGVEFDKEANKNFTRGEVCKISKDSSKVDVYVIPTDEELSIARQSKDILEKQ